MKKLLLIAAIVGVSLTGCKKENNDDADFTAVTGITGVPTVAEAGKPLTLAATVAPENATNKTVEWTVKSAGTTGATITGNTLTAPTAGTVTVTATIAGGIAKNTPFTADFTISVKNAEDMPVVTGVTVSPATASVAKGKTQKFTATVAGINLDEASKAVYWTVTGGTKSSTAIAADGTLTVADDETAASLTVKATSAVDNTKSGTAAVTVTTTSVPIIDVYTAGYEENADDKTMVKVWKNSEELFTLATIDDFSFSSINGIFVAGNDVYVAGEVRERNKNGNYAYIGKVWKNDKELYSFDNGVNSSYVRGVYVSGEDVYTAGYESVTSAWNSKRIGWVRKNGEILYHLANNSSNDPDPTVSAMYVSGNDIYVSGQAANYLGRYLATVWKNGSLLFTFGPTSSSGSYWSDTYDIAVSGNVVYVSGYSGFSYNHVIGTYNGTVNMAFSDAAYSLDVFDNRLYSVLGRKTVRDNVVNWDSYENVSIYDISVKNSVRYVCGYESNVAKVWSNGEELYALTDGTYAARATAIFVVEN